MKALSQLKGFFKLAIERELIGSDQLMYMHIFMKLNEEHWPETTCIGDAELLKRMRLRDVSGKAASIEVVRRGRQRLKNRGLIEFESGKGHEVEYRLVNLEGDAPPADRCAEGVVVANKRVREKEDVKTKKSASAHEEQLELIGGKRDEEGDTRNAHD